jgi:hypothetical protein
VEVPPDQLADLLVAVKETAIERRRSINDDELRGLVNQSLKRSHT